MKTFGPMALLTALRVIGGGAARRPMRVNPPTPERVRRLEELARADG